MSWFASTQAAPYFLTTADLNDVMLNGVLEAPLLSDPPRSVSLMSASVQQHTPSPLPPHHPLPSATPLLNQHTAIATAATVGTMIQHTPVLAGPVSALSTISAGAGGGGGSVDADDAASQCVTLVDGSDHVTAVGTAELTAAIGPHELADWAYQDYTGYEHDLKQEQIDFDGEDELGVCADVRRKTAQNNSKKPKVHLDPKLKLKGPITYEKDVDISVIPIERDGMARCKKCGAIGVRHAFYTRERKYCSLRCARSVEGVESANGGVANGDMGGANGDMGVVNGDVGVVNGEEGMVFSAMGGESVDSPGSDIGAAGDSFTAMAAGSPGSCGTNESGGASDPISDPSGAPWCTPVGQPHYSWDVAMRRDLSFQAVPVTCFSHAPLSRCWYNVCVGMKVEVPNNNSSGCGSMFGDLAADGMSPAHWVASVLRIEGYRALVRYEGSDGDVMTASGGDCGGVDDFWVDLCSDEVHPVGWCALQGRPLIPPSQLMVQGVVDWNQLLMKRLTGARTLPSNFHHKVLRALGSQLREGQVIEVVDKCCMAQVRAATISQVIGRRLHVHYLDAPADDGGFWCHENSPLVHSAGWAVSVGHRISAPSDYLLRCETGNYLPNDATQEFLPTPPPVTHEGFKVGMMLETIDPLNLSVISVATVQHVLASHYLMLRFETHAPHQGRSGSTSTSSTSAGCPSAGVVDSASPSAASLVAAVAAETIGDDCFCYHASSPLLFAPGFAQAAGLPLQPPHDHNASSGAFSWEAYVRQVRASGDVSRQRVRLAPTHLFHRPPLNHGFQVGHRLEAVDLMDPQLVCAATVTAVCGRLLRVHFDGWHDQFDQWLDASSPDIFPCGWCRLVGHRLEPPRQSSAVLQQQQQQSTTGKRLAGAGGTGTSCSRRRQTRRARATKLARTADAARPVSSDSPPLNPPTHTASNQQQHVPPSLEPCHPLQHHQQQLPPPDTLMSATIVDIVYSPSPSSSTSSPPPPLIPCLTDHQQQQQGGSGVGTAGTASSSSIAPDTWSVHQVCHFLRVNQCASHCASFSRAGIDGAQLLQLSREQLLQLAGGKVGPSLKIDNLLDKLRARVAPAQCRQRVRGPGKQ